LSSHLFPFFTGISARSFLAAHDAILRDKTGAPSVELHFSDAISQRKDESQFLFVCLFVCHENKRHNSRRRRHLFGALVLLTGNPTRP
jgi:hypothetical protein